ncbi:MAG: GNAT family protein [Syntrophomonadaceae bacterium]
MNSSEIHTSNFLLRKIENADLKILHSYWSDEVVTKFMNTSFKSLDESQAMIDLLNGLPENNEGRRWAIVEKTTGRVIGSCGYHNVKAEHRRVEIGYELGFEFWGRGVMQEVLTAVLEYCFVNEGFNRIEAFVTEGNTRSVNTLEQLGFKIEGLLREYEITQGQFRNQKILALLRRDWDMR